MKYIKYNIFTETKSVSEFSTSTKAFTSMYLYLIDCGLVARQQRECSCADYLSSSTFFRILLFALTPYTPQLIGAYSLIE